MLGDRESSRTIALYCRDEVPVQIAAIEAALAAGDLEEVKRLSHRLKGSAGNVQAEMLHQLVTELHRAATSGAMETLGRLLVEVRRHWPLLVATIDEQLNG